MVVERAARARALSCTSFALARSCYALAISLLSDAYGRSWAWFGVPDAARGWNRAWDQPTAPSDQADSANP